MSDEDAMVAAAAAAMILVEVAASQHQRRPRRFWIRPSLIHGRSKYNTTQFMKDLLLDEVDDLKLEYRCDAGFRIFFRMKSSEFENILRMIAPIISKRDTTYRKAITARERFAVTMRFLATGDSYTSLSYMFEISKQIISSIIHDVYDAICSVLEGEVKVRKILPNQTPW
ncbi:hypothetical protein JTB14_007449 [Gonioctena quinquepunctata]|nr:hypothetical protein JTB14_007449 [Gonioctena quinquepunctata]